MKSLNETIKERPVSKAKSERALLISDFIAYLEMESGRTMKPDQVRYFCVKTSHLKLPDLRWLYAEGRKYNKEGKGAFGKYVYGSLKPLTKTPRVH